MKVEVRYQSKSGNTEKVARAIAKQMGVEAQNVRVPLPDEVDLLFLGGAIYAGSINKDLKAFLKSLKPGQVKHVVLFSTSMGTKNITAQVEKHLQDNAKLHEEELHIQSKDVDASLEKAAEFAEKVSIAYRM